MDSKFIKEVKAKMNRLTTPMKKIKKLTKEQEAKLPEYCAKWEAIGKNTKRLDRKKCEQLIALIYKQAGYKMPKVVKWYESPHAMVQDNKTLMTYDDEGHLDGICYGSMDEKLSFYDFFIEEFNLECCKEMIPFIELAKLGMGWWMPFDDEVFCCEPPTICEMKNGKLHRDYGPALAWEDNTKLYFKNGKRIPKSALDDLLNSLKGKDVLNKIK